MAQAKTLEDLKASLKTLSEQSRSAVVQDKWHLVPEIAEKIEKVQGEIALMEKKASDAILKPPLVALPLQDIESTKADLEAEFESKKKTYDLCTRPLIHDLEALKEIIQQTPTVALANEGAELSAKIAAAKLTFEEETNLISKQLSIMNDIRADIVKAEQTYQKINKQKKDLLNAAQAADSSTLTKLSKSNSTLTKQYGENIKSLIHRFENFQKKFTSKPKTPTPTPPSPQDTALTSPEPTAPTPAPTDVLPPTPGTAASPPTTPNPVAQTEGITNLQPLPPNNPTGDTPTTQQRPPSPLSPHSSLPRIFRNAIDTSANADSRTATQTYHRSEQEMQNDFYTTPLVESPPRQAREPTPPPPRRTTRSSTKINCASPRG